MRVSGIVLIYEGQWYRVLIYEGQWYSVDL